MKWSQDFPQISRWLRLPRLDARLVPDLFASPVPATRADVGHGIVVLPGDVPVDNPAGLTLELYTPPELAERPALLVLLHGCGQNAADFARDSGWIAMADRLGMIVALPQQSAGNNQARCFSWFRESATKRGGSEAVSVQSFVAAIQATFGCVPERTFVAGLSAGGAMAAALMAAYPESYAAGLVVAGLPVGCAQGPTQAMMRMADARTDLDAAGLADLARRVGPAGHAGRYPRLSIWHGMADTVVVPGNGALLADQWRLLASAPAAPVSDAMVSEGLRRRVWGRGRLPAAELWTVEAMGHAYPVAQGEAHGAQWMAAAPVSATEAFANFAGLI